MTNITMTLKRDTDIVTIERDDGPANAQGDETFTAHENGGRTNFNRMDQQTMLQVVTGYLDAGYRLATEAAPSN
jgi:hypothetical protein